jgi:uncharacterized coiled-coil protein SlyX
MSKNEIKELSDRLKAQILRIDSNAGTLYKCEKRQLTLEEKCAKFEERLSALEKHFAFDGTLNARHENLKTRIMDLEDRVYHLASKMDPINAQTKTIKPEKKRK